MRFLAEVIENVLRYFLGYAVGAERLRWFSAALSFSHQFPFQET